MQGNKGGGSSKGSLGPPDPKVTGAQGGSTRAGNAAAVVGKRSALSTAGVAARAACKAAEASAPAPAVDGSASAEAAGGGGAGVPAAPPPLPPPRASPPKRPLSATSAAAAGTSHAAATAGGDQAPGAPRAAATSAGGNQAPAAPRAAWGSSLSALQLPGEGEEEGEWEWDGMEDLEQPGIEGHPCNFMRFPNAVLCACGSCFREELSNTSNHPDAYRPPHQVWCTCTSCGVLGQTGMERPGCSCGWTIEQLNEFFGLNGESNPPAGGDYRLRGGPWRSCGCTPEHLYEHGGAGAGESNPPAGKDFRESNPPAGGDFRLRGGDEGGEGNAPGDGALGARKDRTLDMLRTRLEKRDHMRTLPPSDADLLQASRCPISALHLLHNNSGLGDHRDLFQLTYCTLTKEERALAIEGAKKALKRVAEETKGAQGNITKAYQAAINPDRILYACACCGESNFSAVGGYSRVSLARMGPLRYSNSLKDVERWERITRAHGLVEEESGRTYDCVFNYYPVLPGGEEAAPPREDHYHLIPDFVDTDASGNTSAMLCKRERERERESFIYIDVSPFVPLCARLFVCQ